MFAWLKALLPNAAKDAPEVTAAAAAMEQGREEVAGLNFRTAIEAHLKWKGRLADYVTGRSAEDLQVEIAGRDDPCPLGKWIHGPGGERFEREPQFGTLRAKHARFHVCPAAVLSQAQRGDGEGALRMLRAGDYLRASVDVTRELAALYQRLERR